MKKQSPVKQKSIEQQNIFESASRTPIQSENSMKDSNNAQCKENTTIIPIRKICFNHIQFEQPLFNINLKVFSSHNFLNIFITNSKSQYTIIIKKENIKTQYIISDVIKNTLLIKGSNFQFLQGSGMVNSYTLPIQPNQRQENIVLHPVSLLQSLSELKNTIFFQKKEKKQKKEKEKEKDKKQKKKPKKEFEDLGDKYSIVGNVDKIQSKKERVHRKAERKASQRIEQMMKKHENVNSNESQKESVPLLKIQEQIQEPEEYIENFNPQFIKPPPQRYQQGEKLKQKLKKMSNEEKEDIFFNIFKIKKIKKKKIIACPIYNCGKTFVSHTNLSSHFESKHAFLSNYGIEIKNGNIQYSEKAMNMVLYLGKVYCEDVKKIIRGMKLNVK